MMRWFKVDILLLYAAVLAFAWLAYRPDQKQEDPSPVGYQAVWDELDANAQVGLYDEADSLLFSGNKVEVNEYIRTHQEFLLQEPAPPLAQPADTVGIFR